MRAAVYRGPGDLSIEDVPEPVPGPNEVKIEVAFNGICGSDLHKTAPKSTICRRLIARPGRCCGAGR